MEHQRWAQIEQIYHSARERDRGQRHAFLAEVCLGDEGLRREIESLLAQDDSRECILDRPAAELLDDFTRSQSAAFSSADHLGPFAAGTLLAGRFRILRVAGSGGMGFVYESLDEKLNQHVALKCAKPGYGDRLPPEVRAAREVSHFNVCKVHDLHVAATPLGEMEFLSMEFIDGQTLSERIERDGPVPDREAREIARQICAGLAQAHRQGVIHGDLKPGNIILVSQPRNASRVVITDFGIATMKPLDGGPMAAGHGGTPDFMAPELFRGERTSVASDIYALGILFHVMLSGHAPKRIGIADEPFMNGPVKAGSTADTITAEPVLIANVWQRAMDDLPAHWSGLIARCIAPRPEDRYGSAEAVSHALQPRRLLLKGSGLAAAMVALAFGYWQWSTPPAGPPVRLAVLPFSVEGDPIPGTEGIGLDVANRLSGARRNFTVISPREARRYGVETPLNAKNMLGATHVLETRLRRTGAMIGASATLTDLASGRPLGRPLDGTYAAGDSAALAKAVLATVTGAFELRARAPVESVSGEAYPQYIQGMYLLQQDGSNSDQAIGHFQKAIELEPRSALPYAGLAEAQIQKFDKREGPQWLEMAAANVAKAEAINADSVPVLLVSGKLQESHGAYEPALRAFARATELDPNNPEAWRRLAGAFDKANRTDEAIATYRRAMKAQPNYYGNFLSLGNLYWYRGEFREAEDLYRRVAIIAPDLSAGHMDLGLALTEQGRFQEAEVSLLHALRLSRSPRALMNVGALYYAEERYAEATGFFEESVASGTPSAIRYTDLGDGYRHLGRSQEARKAYGLARDAAREEVIRNPLLADSRMLLALVSALLGDLPSARFEASQALSMEPENAMVMRDAVLMYEVLRQREESLRVLRRAPRWLLTELSRQPDVKDLQQDSRFQELIQAQKTR
ncbi:MAG TPA: tetratricopeptide repeat protein [Bryobacteraceae bacterium]|nr:tetratricopeptide repeat protein [Bryobacteraceae bacterium]